MKRATPIAVLCSLVLAATASLASAQPASELRIDNVEIEAHPAVRLDVSVPTGLDVADVSEQLRLFEADEPAEAVITQAASADLQVVLIIDTTGSMGGPPIAAAKSAAKTFIDRLPRDTRVSVVSYDTDVEVESTFEASRAEHAAAIDALVADGRTAMYDSVVAAVDLFPDAAPQDRQAIVLLTDGEDNASSASVADVIATLEDARIVFHGVEYNTAFTDSTGVQAFADATGGSVQAADDPGALVGLYDQLAANLVSSYVIQYETAIEGATELRVDFDRGSEVLTTTVPVTFPSRGSEPAAPPPTESAPQPVAEQPTAEPVSRFALYLGAGAWFLALTLLLTAAFWPRERSVQLSGARRGWGRTRAHEVAERVTLVTGRTLERRGFERGLNAALERAGINLRPDEFVILVASTAVVSGIVGSLLSGPLGGLALAVLTLIAARITVSVRTDRRQRRFADQLGDTLQLLSGSLRAGHSLMQAIDAVAREADAPTSEEFSRLVVETRLGRDASEALRALASRLSSDDFSWVVQAIEIHREVGGDLSEVLENVGTTIRERDGIRRQIRTVSAEGRLSGIVLICLPFVIGLWMTITNPSYIGELTTGLVGWIMLATCVVLLTVGALWIRVLVRLRF